MENKNIAKLTGAQRVAIVLLSLTEENATKIFSLMTEEEVKDVSQAMSYLGAVSPDVIHHVLSQLNNDLTGDKLFFGNLHTTEKLLEKILTKEQVQALMDEIRGPQGRNTWEKLGNVNEELLALYFRNEHPQTAALVLSKISPDHAAKVLSNLPDAFAFEIIVRILNIGNVQKEVLEKVEKTLRAEFISSIGKSQKQDSFEMIADIFTNLDRNNEGKYMAMLELQIPEAASKVKDLMFTFEDLVKVHSRGIQRLLRDIEKSKLTIALKGASDRLKKVFFASMSQRVAKIIAEDLESLGPVRVREVDAARSEIISIAKNLIANGEIDIAVDNKDEFIS